MLTSEKLKASVVTAFSPSTTVAWRRFSLLRRLQYSGEFATRRTLAVSPGSLLMVAATLMMSMSGSLASSMICCAMAGGLGKLTAVFSLFCRSSSIGIAALS